MKIVRSQPLPSQQPQPGAARAGWYTRWYVQLLFVLAAFAAGALFYRQGYIRPVTAFARNLLSGEGPTLPAPLAEAEKNIAAEARLYANNGLPTLYLDIPFKGYQQMADKRAEALKVGILLSSDADYVSARLSYKDLKNADIDMRLKGDWTDHIAGDKWSFRIHMKDNQYLDGMRQFSIQAPETRQFLKEWVFHQHLIQENILSPRYQFLNVLVNGEAKGIFALEENFAKELMESQGRRAGVIIRFDEDLLWQNRADFRQKGIESESTFMVTDVNSADILPFSAGSIAKDENLSKEAATAVGKLRAYQAGLRPAAEVFDVRAMGRFYALSDLWGACHNTFWHNLRFYYNPVTSLLEPVIFDAEPFNCGGDPHAGLQNTSSLASEFAQNHDSIFNDPQIRQAYMDEMERVTRPEYIQGLMKSYGKQGDALYQALRVEYPNSDLVDIPWQTLEKRAARLRIQLDPAQPVRGAVQTVQKTENGRTQSYIQLDLVNLMIAPVDVLRLEVNEQSYTPQNSWVLPQTGLMTHVDAPTPTLLPVTQPGEDAFNPVQFLIPGEIPQPKTKDDEPAAVYAVVRLAGLEKEYRVPLLETTLPQAVVSGPRPAAPSLAEALQQHPFLYSPDEGKSLWAKPGEWDVQGNLVLPQGVPLTVPAGTTLRFGKENYLLAEAAVNLLGSAERPAVLTAQQESWQGVLVIQAAQPSLWEYATVENTSGIAQDGWMTTGSTTFYESEITLRNTRLLHASSEDMINVMHSKFVFDHSEFAYSASDSFDSDYAAGDIIGCSFHDIGADAIDISSAEVHVRDTTGYNLGDKGISAGEHAEIYADNVRFENVNIGVASKDLSKLFINHIIIRNAKHVALAAYQKKATFGPGYMEVNDLTVEDSPTFAMIQTGSTAKVDGKPLETMEMDVAALYKNQFLGN